MKIVGWTFFSVFVLLILLNLRVLDLLVPFYFLQLCVLLPIYSLEFPPDL